MGTGTSKKAIFNQNGNIIIHTDKARYIPGDIVSGKIYLHTFSPHPPCQLELKFYGIELSCLVTSHDGSSSLNQQHRQFNNASWNLHQWESGLSGAHIEIPFSFTLPLDLPSSFHQEGIGFLGHISYILWAELKPLNNATKFQPVAGYTKLVVRRPIRRPPKCYSEEKQLPITLCCCIPQGFATMRVHMEKDIYSQQEVAKVCLEIDNMQGKCDISSAQVRLLQILHINTTYEIQLPICAVAMPRIPANTKSEPQVLQLNIPRFMGDRHNIEARTSLWPQGQTRNNNGELGLTTQGRFIRSEFYLEVVCFRGGYEASKVRHHIEIIYPDPQPKRLKLPADWNPQKLANILLQISPPIEKSIEQNKESNNGKMIETEMIRNGRQV